MKWFTTSSVVHKPWSTESQKSKIKQKRAGSSLRTLTLSFTLSLHAEQLLFSCLGSKVTLSFSHTLTLTLSHSITLHMLNNFCFHGHAQKSLSHSFTLSFTLSRHAEQLLFSCLCSKVTLSLSHSLTLTLSHSLSLDTLNNFGFHVYAEN